MNNLTPDENLKNPIRYNPGEEPIKIYGNSRDTYDTVEAPGIIFGDAISNEELAESGATVIVFLFTALLVVAIGILLYYLL